VRNLYEISVQNPLVPVRLCSCLEDNIKIDLKNMERGCRDWTQFVSKGVLVRSCVPGSVDDSQLLKQRCAPTLLAVYV
jgi:hypothetical protein